MADRAPIDLIPPIRELTRLLLGVTDGDLGAPTPCADWTVGALLAHVHGLARAFARAAGERSGERATAPRPRPSAADLPRHWRSGLPARLEALATAWRDPAAWRGGTQVGGVSLPAAAAGMFASVELVVHGWDLARATDQEFAADPRTLAVLAEFLAGHPGGDPGPYGPAVPAGDEATLLDRVVALTGRDPRWRPGRQVSAPSASAAG